MGGSEMLANNRQAAARGADSRELLIRLDDPGVECCALLTRFFQPERGSTRDNQMAHLPERASMHDRRAAGQGCQFT